MDGALPATPIAEGADCHGGRETLLEAARAAGYADLLAPPTAAIRNSPP